MGELFFATEDLGASEAGFSALVALFGLGFVLGSLSGAQGGTLPELKRAYLLGLAVMGGGLLATGLAPAFGVALATFALAGFGNGVVLVYERLLIQRTVADELAGRVFGIKDAMACWAFALAFLAAGGAITLIGTRTLLIVAGAVGVAVWGASAVTAARALADRRRGRSENGPRWRSGRRAGMAVRAASTARMSSAGERPSSGWVCSTTRISAATTRGSNWVPALALSSCDRLGARERLAVHAVAGHRVVGVAGEHDPRGERDLLAGDAVRIALAVLTLVAGPHDLPDAAQQPAHRSSMNWPSIVWVFMTANSSAVSLAGLFRISFGIAILPMSCSIAANSSSWRAFGSMPSSSAVAFTSSTTERLCSAVYSSSNSTTSDSSITVPR